MKNLLLDSFSPILLLTNIIGCLHTPTTKRYYLQKIHTFVLATLYTIVAARCFFYLIPSISGPTAILRAIDWFQMIFGYILSMSFFYKAFSSRKKLRELFEKLALIDREFFKLGIYLDYNQIKRNLIIQIFFSTLLACTVLTLMSFYYSYDIFWVDFFVTILLYTPIFMMDYVSILFLNIVNQIHLRYKKINKFLKHLKQDENIEKPIYDVLNIYQELTEVIEILNEIFGISNLMSISKLSLVDL